MAAEIKLPLHMRVGTYPETHIGDLTVPLIDGELRLATIRHELAEGLRAAADEIEHPTVDDDEEEEPT